MGLLTHPFPRVSSFKLKTPDSDSVLVSGSDSVRAASSRWNLWGKLFALPLCVHIHSVSLGSQLLGALRVNCTSRAVSLSLFLKEIIQFVEASAKDHELNPLTDWLARLL